MPGDRLRIQIQEEQIARSAKGMIRNFGCQAEERAYEQVRRMKGRHDEDGARCWLAIAEAISKLSPENDQPQRSPLDQQFGHLPAGAP